MLIIYVRVNISLVIPMKGPTAYRRALVAVDWEATRQLFGCRALDVLHYRQQLKTNYKTRATKTLAV
jgi:hypothetical protein